jgi:cytochrome P450
MRDWKAIRSRNRSPVSRSRDAVEVHVSGHHNLCLGAALARLEAKIAVSSLLARFPELALGGGDLVRVQSVAIRGVLSLPVTA